MEGKPKTFNLPAIVYHFHPGAPPYRGFKRKETPKVYNVIVSTHDTTALLYLKVKYATGTPDENAKSLGMIANGDDPPIKWGEGVEPIAIRGDIKVKDVGIDGMTTICIQHGLRPGVSD